MNRVECWLFAIIAATLGPASGCDSAGRRCRFGSDHAVFRSEGPVFDDVALVELATGPVALFSDASGVYKRELDAYGLPRSRAQRIGERCDAGLAAAVGGKDNQQAWLACARAAPADAEPATGGAVSVYLLGDRVEEHRRIGPVGSESHGIALLVRGSEVFVAWQDAAIGGAAVRYADNRTIVSRVLSDRDWFASTPRLSITRDSQLVALWDESQERGRDTYESRVRMLDPSKRVRPGAAATVMEAHDASPGPAIAVDPGTNASWLAFRDRRKGGRKAGLYLAKLNGNKPSEAVRVGRADGVGRPTLTACLGGLVAATARTFAGDYFVGVVQADRELQSFSLEQQFYEDSHEFSQVAATCLDARLLLLIAERGAFPPRGGRAALRSVGFSCE